MTRRAAALFAALRALETEDWVLRDQLADDSDGPYGFDVPDVLIELRRAAEEADQ